MAVHNDLQSFRPRKEKVFVLPSATIPGKNLTINGGESAQFCSNWVFFKKNCENAPNFVLWVLFKKWFEKEG